MIEIWGTVEQLTAETSWAPILMIPACSALAPTMKPVTLWRKTIGVFLAIRQFTGFIFHDVVTYC